VQSPIDILKRYWQFTAFRPLQEEIINAVLSGEDVLALMPTGGGKSLCYQVPAMAMEGLCLVISPLIALMKDQVENLRKKNITAFAIYAGMTRKEVINILKLATESNCKFLYVSPERLETKLFREYLPGMAINLVAVDEAHCISQWGYDFRPPYLRIADLRKELPGIPVLALTASATPEVQEDICDKLTPVSQAGKPSRWKIFRQSFERPNLSYSVFATESRFNRITEILQKVKGSAIVYCKTRKRTREISDLLRLQQVSADYYHAGLAQEERSRKQESWIAGKIKVIVCTNAFGMGIDKPDVRIVIHADTPDCLENYYQEAGRAGRDGKKSYAVLLYDDAELEELAAMPALRYPALGDIREVYKAMANYLQIPVGGGEGEYHDFDLPDFIKKFNLPLHTALYGLKALEQDGWLSFNDQFFKPSVVEFTATKQYLYAFEEAQPQLEPVIKSLLRAYEGIFDQPVQVSEKNLAYLLRMDMAAVKEALQQLHQHRIINYQLQKDTPQLSLLRSRVPADELVIDMTAYHRRKELFIKRVEEITRFVTDTQNCRSKMIGSYFGDDNLGNCGICDNCLNRVSQPLTTDELNIIYEQVKTLLSKQPLHSKELATKLTGSKEHIWKTLEYLQSENKIQLDKEGMVRLK